MNALLVNDGNYTKRWDFNYLSTTLVEGNSSEMAIAIFRKNQLTHTADGNQLNRSEPLNLSAVNLRKYYFKTNYCETIQSPSFSQQSNQTQTF